MTYRYLVLTAAALCLSQFSHSAEVNLTCTSPTENEDGSPLTDLAGIRFYVGESSGGYTQSYDWPGCAATITVPDNGATWYFAATAVNSAGVESGFSNEVTRLVGGPELPGVVSDLVISWIESSSIYSLPSTVVPPFVNAGQFNVGPDSLSIDFTITPLVGSDGDARIISKATGSGEQDHIFMVSLYNGSLRFRLKTNGATSTLIATAPVPFGVESTGRAVYDGSAMQIWLNGVIVAQAAKSGQINQSPASVWVGANPPNGYGAFNGQISVTVN